jgi:hypothetical protein
MQKGLDLGAKLFDRLVGNAVAAREAMAFEVHGKYNVSIKCELNCQLHPRVRALTKPMEKAKRASFLCCDVLDTCCEIVVSRLITGYVVPVDADAAG